MDFSFLALPSTCSFLTRDAIDLGPVSDKRCIEFCFAEETDPDGSERLPLAYGTSVNTLRNAQGNRRRHLG